MTTDLRERLAAADPAADASGYSPSQCDAVTEAILGGSTPVHHRTLRPGRRVKVTFVAASVIAVIAALATVHSPAGASDAARSVLVTSATNASDPPAKPSQYWEMTQTSPQGRTHTEYVAVDGNRPSYYLDTYPAGGGQPEIWTTNLTPNQSPGMWQAPTSAFWATLPRDPNALRERLYEDTRGRGNSTDGEVFVYIADFLRSGMVPADLRRSIFQVLQTVPGVEVMATNVVVSGRTGVVIGYQERASWGLHQILLDPNAGAMLGEWYDDSKAWSTITKNVVDDVPASVRAAARHDDCYVMNGQGVACTLGSPPPT